MNIGVVGAGRIGGNLARQAVRRRHAVALSFSREPSSLIELATELGNRASAGTPREAVEFGGLVVLSVPWDVIPHALELAGDLSGKVVVDTTNQYGSGPMPAHGETAAGRPSISSGLSAIPLALMA